MVYYIQGVWSSTRQVQVFMNVKTIPKVQYILYGTRIQWFFKSLSAEQINESEVF